MDIIIIINIYPSVFKLNLDKKYYNKVIILIMNIILLH